jgi:nucleotide-binding universal stress UspA family protein
VTDLGGSWAVAFDLAPWIITVVKPSEVPIEPRPGHEPVVEARGLHRLVGRLSGRLGRQVKWQVLLGQNPAEELIAFARSASVAVIAMGTQGATGLSRLVVGSVCAATVRGAPCPVLVQPTSG